MSNQATPSVDRVTDKIRIFLNPILIVIIGFFLNKELVSIENKIDMIPGLQLKMALMESSMERMKNDIIKLQDKIEYQDKIYGKLEEERPPAQYQTIKKR